MTTLPNGSAESTLPTSGSEWRKPREQGVLFHFPSGMRALVRPIGTGTFLRAGEIPDILTGVVNKLLNEGMDALSEVSNEDALKVDALMNIFCQTCFLQPRIVDDPQNDDEISLADLSDVDKGALFSFLGRPAVELATFRPQQADDVAALEREQNKRNTPKRPDRR